MPRPIPQDTRNALEDFGTPSNFALAFHRYLNHPETDLQNWTGAEPETEMWEHLKEQADEIFSSAHDHSTQAALDQQHARYDRILDLRQQRWGPNAGCCCDAKVAWRLLIGLSAPSVLNNGITLHPLFGFPYLPASGLKGLLHHFRLYQIAEQVGVRPLTPQRIAEREQEHTPWQQLEALLCAAEPETSKEREGMKEDFERLRADMESVAKRLREALRSRESESSEDEAAATTGVTCDLATLRNEYAEDYRRAFGSPDQQGRVTFFDVLPRALMVGDESLLEHDVVTPHNREYHVDDESPADYLSPIPVRMLAVRRGVCFAFRMTCPDSQLLDTVHGWLKQAIAFWGAGAKTRSGYGELIAREEAPDAA